MPRTPHGRLAKTQPRPRPGLFGPGLLTPGGFRVNDTSPRPRVKYTRHAMGASRVISAAGALIREGLQQKGHLTA